MNINYTEIVSKEDKKELFGDKHKDAVVYMNILEKVIEERCDELDYSLEAEGHQIIHREYITVATSIFNYQVYYI